MNPIAGTFTDRGRATVLPKYKKTYQEVLEDSPAESGK